MTELSPLAEAATASVLTLFAGLPMARRRTGFIQALRRQSLTALRIPTHVALVLAGIALGVGAWMARHVVGMVYVLTELWSARAAQVLWSLRQSLGQYCDKRRFYQAQHAA